MNNIQKHYDHVSEAWQYIMGENLHYGLFNSPTDSLNLATQQLMDAMFKHVSIDKAKGKAHILDVGCGTGGPAFYLHERFNAQVTGIALGKTEIKNAIKNAKAKGLNKEINFLLADGQNNQLADNSFDLVIMMESSLLIPDKQKLFNENFRVLKPNSAIVICDQIKINTLPTSDMYRMGNKLEALQDTFGDTKTETLKNYQHILEKAGFTNIQLQDVSKAVNQTPKYWKANCLAHKNEILKYISVKTFEQFLLAFDTLQELLEKQILGYGIIYGEKK